MGWFGWLDGLVVQYHQTATPHPPSRQRRRDSGESSYFGESGESGYFGESGETGELVILVTLVVQYHPTATPPQASQQAAATMRRFVLCVFCTEHIAMHCIGYNCTGPNKQTNQTIGCSQYPIGLLSDVGWGVAGTPWWGLSCQASIHSQTQIGSRLWDPPQLFGRFSLWLIPVWGSSFPGALLVLQLPGSQLGFDRQQKCKLAGWK